VQQKAFDDDYTPTPAIQIAHINWSYKVHDDPVLVEVWDVVDHASQSSSSSSSSSAATTANGASELKLSHQDTNIGASLSPVDALAAATGVSSSPLSIPSAANNNGASIASSPSMLSAATPLSADVVDVYQRAQCVIFMIDPRKEWTFEYVEREAPRVPASCFVLVLCNFADDVESPVKVSPARIVSLVADLNAGSSLAPGTARARALRCALKDDFGLNAVVSSFNIPYLAAKRLSLLQQVQTLDGELDHAVREHDEHAAAQNYQAHRDLLAELERNRGKGRKATVTLPTAPVESKPSAGTPSSSTPASTNATPITSPITSPRLPERNKSKHAAEPSPPASTGSTRSTAAAAPAKPAAPLSEKSSIDKDSIKATATKQAPPAPIEKSDSFFSRMKRRLTGVDNVDPMKKAQQKANEDLERAQVKEAPAPSKPISDVTEFNAGYLDDAFWGPADDGEGLAGKVATAVGLKKKAQVHTESDDEDDDKPAAAIITQDEDLAGDIVQPTGAKAARKPEPKRAPAPAAKAPVVAAPVVAEGDDAGWGHESDDDDDGGGGGNPMMLADEDLDGPEQVFSAPAAKRTEVFREPPKAAPVAKPAPAPTQAHSAVDDFDPTGDDDDGDDGDVFSSQPRRTAADYAPDDGDNDDDLFSAPPPAKPAAPPSSRLPQPKADAARPAMVEEDDDPFGEVATEAANSLVLDEEDPFGDVVAPRLAAAAAPRGGGAVRGRGGPPPAGAMRGRVRGRARGAPPPTGRGGRPPRRPSRAL
jgi:hypothetical protein